MNSNYLLKLWLSVILVAPLLFILTMAITNDIDYSGAVIYYGVCVFYSLLFSVPTLVLFLLLSFFVEDKIKSSRGLKIYFISISVICMILTFRVLFGPHSYSSDSGPGGLLIAGIYAFSIIVFGLIYKVKPAPVQNVETTRNPG